MSDPSMTELKEQLVRLSYRGDDPGPEWLIASVRAARADHGSEFRAVDAPRRRAFATVAIAFVAVVAITIAAVALVPRNHSSRPALPPAPIPAQAGSVSAPYSQPALTTQQEGWICDYPLHYTVDGGQRWQSIALPVVGRPGVLCAFRAGGRGWIAMYDLTHRPAIVRVVAGPHPSASRVELPRATTNSVIVSVAFANDDRGWVLTTVNGSNPPQNRLYATVDGGRQWQLLAARTPVTGSLEFTSATQGWAVADATLRHTADGGRTWDRVPVALPSATGPVVLKSVFVFGNRLVVAGRRGTDRDLPRAKAFVDVSNDNGHTWAMHQFTGDLAKEAAYAIVWAHGAFGALDATHWHIFLGNLWITNDAGATWAMQPPAYVLNGGFDGGVGFATPDVAWLSLCKGRVACQPVVARTRDGGTTWALLTRP